MGDVRIPMLMVLLGLWTACLADSFCHRYCGGVINGRRGVIESPGFGNFDGYEENMRCCWKIIGPSNGMIRLNIEEMDIEPHSRCSYDYLQIYESTDVPDADQELSGPLCGSTLPVQTTFQSSTNELMVFLYTDTGFNGRGFKASFRTIFPVDPDAPQEPKKTNCGNEVLFGNNGEIFNPGYVNGTYAPLLHCNWTIDAPPGAVIDILFHDFLIQDSPSCEADYLQIIDRNAISNANMSGKYCGGAPALQTGFRSEGNIVDFIFSTDEEIETGFGFSLSYEFVEDCDLFIFGRDQNYFSIPPSGTPAYATDHECIITVSVWQHFTVTLSFDTFDIASGPCDDEFVQVFSDYSMTEENELSEKMCGTEGQGREFTNSTLVVQFKSDGYPPGVGFSAWLEVHSPCGGDLTEASGELSSFNFPGLYIDDLRCVWHRTAATGFYIVVNVNYLDIEYENNCGYDSLEFFDGPEVDGNTRIGPPLCNTTLPAPLFTSGNELTIYFYTDGSVQGTGFQLNYFEVPS